MAEARYYSLRRLSPYQGTAQVAELPGFRAMSVDGESWRVQFLNMRARLSGNAIWREDGRGNLIETEHTRAIIEALRARPPLPFRLADSLELWLLDGREQRPLALLASALPERSPPRIAAVRWASSLEGNDGFFAPSLAGEGSHASFIPHRDVLDRCVQRAAGARAQAQWFRRADDRSGTGLPTQGLDRSLAARRLGAAEFPELLLREDWDREDERNLVADYHAWHAPHLLTHTTLSDGVRERLEDAACGQVRKLYRVRRLLPKVLNEERVRVALVEALIRGAS
ncbi:hypothetical protein SVA_0521 [Sulfurifustis variabilis]|uniref:Uncharacterized protein n=1 Tax=Sulfurifustis variabilis TaxID=1675686 RepID=A0A1B4V3M3_9GAMM|nr:hypothetical protein [Sulfurifustis variabilis]BAU47102.1 hypothetical protein SVA_0521 [Sulfurifustis variabilis]